MKLSQLQPEAKCILQAMCSLLCTVRIGRFLDVTLSQNCFLMKTQLTTQNYNNYLSRIHSLYLQTAKSPLH